MAIPRKPIDPSDTPTRLIKRHCADILASRTMEIEARCIQHGTTSVLEHSATVTAVALILTSRLHIPVDERALTRSALLHDYFLYDWHDPDPSHRLHGFRHPYFAARNARRDFGATPHEQAIIRTHMFPLIPIPPTSREALIVCLADKLVATKETLEGFAVRLRNHKEPRS